MCSFHCVQFSLVRVDIDWVWLEERFIMDSELLVSLYYLYQIGTKFGTFGREVSTHRI